MIQFQLATGARPGEACILRTCDIDMSSDVWEYRPRTHKTIYHGRQRVLFIGPRGQNIIRPYLSADRERYLFSPQAAERARSEARRENRQSPMTPSQSARQAKQDPIRTAGRHYRRDSYTRAIARACELAGVEPWTPNRLRHNAATELRKLFGLEGTRTVLGHSNADMTEVYAESDFDAARNIMRQVG